MIYSFLAIPLTHLGKANLRLCILHQTASGDQQLLINL